jgi:hypothetical protein
MRVKKEDIVKVLNNIIEIRYNLNQALQIADDKKIPYEDLIIAGNSYSEYIKEIVNNWNELDTLLEAAKESVTDELDDNTINLLNKMNRFDGDLAQEYYMSEKYNNLTFIVNRASKIKPLYTNIKVPASIKRKYREAILCFLDGRFDSCCAMCRSITEIIFKELCKDKFYGKGSFEEKPLSFLINKCEICKLLEEPKLKAARRIKKTGNESMHSRISKNAQDALTSIEDIQKILKDF